MENIDNNRLICLIARDIQKNEIKAFTDLISFVDNKYGDAGILIVSTKTAFFKELVDTNYRFYKEGVGLW